MALFCLLMASAPVFAKDAPQKLQSSTAKAKTIEMLKAADKERWTDARNLAAQAKDPLAAKLYFWMSARRDQKSWSDDAFIQLSHFIRDNGDWPGIVKMKVNAEGVMPPTLSNDEIIAWYDQFPPVTAFGMDRYMGALIINGKTAQAKKFLAGWWGNTSVPREQQRTIYKKYHAYITEEAHRNRLDYLLFSGDNESARAIADVLGKGYPALAEARIGLSRNTNGVNTLIEKVPANLQNDPGLLYERLKWRRKNNMDSGAIEILDKQPPLSKLYNPDEWWKERHIMIRRLMENKQFSKAQRLAASHGLKDGAPYAEAEWLAGWMALRFTNNPKDALSRFESLYDKVETPMSKSRASYWAGRAAAKLGQKDKSLEWYKKGARFQTYYYGQLSAAALFMQSELPKEKGYEPTSTDKDKFKSDELMQAYHLFYQADMKSEATRFLNAFLDRYDLPQAYHYAAVYAAERGDHYDAVRIAKNATRKGMFLTKQSYPTITAWMKNSNNVEMALAHSLIRQESMFDTNARSSAGAMGLMQLMPRTAKEVSGKLGIGYSEAWLHSKPEYNIQLGTSYISRLLKRYDGSYPMAIAAYNAGPGRVDEWIRVFGDPRKGGDFLDWIELIPIYETRNYVQRVMEGVYVYRLRLKDIQSGPLEPIHIAYSVQP